MNNLLWRLRQLGRISIVRRLAYGAMGLRFRPGTVTQIRRGPLKGRRWLNSSSYQFWMPYGQYEPESASWILTELKADDTFFDIGANAGYFTLLGAQEIDPSEGAVVAFEPLEINCAHIEACLDLNALAARVVPVALSDQEREATFIEATTNANSRLESLDQANKKIEQRSAVTVQTTTVDDWIRESGLEPTLLKVDIEGAEAAFLNCATNLLARGQARFLISTHSDQLREACAEILGRHGYTYQSLPGFEHEILAYPPT